MKKLLISILAVVMICVSLMLGGCANGESVEIDEEAVAQYMEENSKSFIYTVNDGNTTMLICDDNDEIDYIRIDGHGKYKRFRNKVEKWMKSVTDEGEDSVPQYAREGITDIMGDYTEEFFEENSLVVIEGIMHWCALGDFYVDDVCISGDTANINVYVDSRGVLYSCRRAIIFVPIPKPEADAIDEIKITETRAPVSGFDAKPVIYLYPETEMNIDVTLGYKDKIIVSYPEYVNGWSVTAQPDGKLVYNETGRRLYSLYYESENVVKFNVENDGFVVKGEDTVAFLEEKLAILGLNEYEMEEFIIYWLPILQANEYNYIRFATADEIERNMPLYISGNPDSIIRILMTYKGLSEPIEVTEQILTTPERSGFVAVEWGGTEIN